MAPVTEGGNPKLIFLDRLLPVILASQYFLTLAGSFSCPRLSDVLALILAIVEFEKIQTYELTGTVPKWVIVNLVIVFPPKVESNNSKGLWIFLSMSVLFIANKYRPNSRLFRGVTCKSPASIKLLMNDGIYCLNNGLYTTGYNPFAHAIKFSFTWIISDKSIQAACSAETSDVAAFSFLCQIPKAVTGLTIAAWYLSLKCLA